METSHRLKNKYGQIILSSNELRELLLQGKSIDHLTVKDDEDMVLFKQYQNIILSNTITFSETPDISISFDNFHNQSADIWNFPKSYQQIDVKQWLLDKCKSPHEINRVEEEYILYANRDLIMLLRLFIFLVDYMRKNKFIWGIGRGSSVSSYILYLIGIHRVDSIRYNLHIEDYLK